MLQAYVIHVLINIKKIINLFLSAVICAACCALEPSDILISILLSPHYSLKLWLEGSIQTDVCSLLFSKLPVQYCAAAMVNTLKVAACVTAAGRAPSVTFPPTSALTSHAVAMGPALWELVSATQATKAKTVKKVIFFNESL